MIVVIDNSFIDSKEHSLEPIWYFIFCFSSPAAATQQLSTDVNFAQTAAIIHVEVNIIEHILEVDEGKTFHYLLLSLV